MNTENINIALPPDSIISDNERADRLRKYAEDAMQKGDLDFSAELYSIANLVEDLSSQDYGNISEMVTVLSIENTKLKDRINELEKQRDILLNEMDVLGKITTDSLVEQKELSHNPEQKYYRLSDQYTSAVDENRRLRGKLVATERLAYYYDAIVKAIHGDEMLQNAWQDFIVILKLRCDPIPGLTHPTM